MTEVEKREGARQFYQKWVNKGREDEDDRSYWIDIFTRILGIENATDHIEFQKKVIIDGNTKKIDAYIPETKVIIEQKSLGISLDKKAIQSGGIMLSPYEQAKRYNDNLPYDEKARWIITSNFAEIWIYDMNTRVPEPIKLFISELPTKFQMLDFIVNQERTDISEEVKLSIKAGELVGLIYDALLKQYINPNSERALKSLNMLCVRLVFCLYAEDAGIFSSNHRIFHDYLVKFEAQDIRKALIDLFKVLNTKDEDRDPYDQSDLSKFPYVNGGLFADEEIEIPHFTEELKTILLSKCSDDFDWSQISPTIFGAVFESTLNPETRHSGGMHYTSIENIHKVIDALFLDDLKQELFKIKQLKTEKIKTSNLKDFQKKLASLKWFDPACGSGNFLTETYISIRRLENEVLKELQKEQIVFGIINPIQVSINQFYGIEINDFAVTVAKTALWIAESQMLKETEDIVHMNLDFLPLKTNATIIEHNALTIDWNTIVSKYEINYIIGNPPFLGMKEQSDLQKKHLQEVTEIKKLKQLDYVAAWYFKAAKYTKGTQIKTAFVSCNSITQGEQALTMWKPLFNLGINIHFAYPTFVWDSEATDKAQVHCVIIGFTHAYVKVKTLYENDKCIACDVINQYLKPEEISFVTKSGKPICNVPEMTKGAQLIDDGHFLINSEAEYKEIINKEPNIAPYIKQYWNARDLLNNGQKKYAFYLENCPPHIINNSPIIKNRVQAVYDFRFNNSKPSTKALANKPSHYFQAQAPTGKSLVIPVVSSQKRRYIPICFMPEGMIYTNALFYIDNASLYELGILSSNVHMAWARKLCGRMKSDYRYSNTIVYNTFPWPKVTNVQKERIMETAQAILDARALYPDSSLSDLYNPLTMPIELQNAHNANNKVVMEAYGFSIKDMSEKMCVEALMNLYDEITNK